MKTQSETVPCDHEYEAYCPNCGIDASDDDQDDTDTTPTTKEV